MLGLRLGSLLLLFSIATAGLAHAADNTPPEGFTSLFNGKDLTNWKGLSLGSDGMALPPSQRTKLTAEEATKLQNAADENMRAHWKVENGALEFDGNGQSLCTAKDYGNFELSIDWKIKKDGDSGIYLRGTPQVQIWDPESAPAGGTGSGGLYNNQKFSSKPTAKADKPIDQWNNFKIKIVDDKVTVRLNDQLVVDNVPLENYWERESPLYPTGTIELQGHKTPLSFKNIYIKELP